MPQEFTLHDFVTQIDRMRPQASPGKTTPILAEIQDMMNQANLSRQDIEQTLTRMRAIYNAMTPPEQEAPDQIEPLARNQIAIRAGVNAQDVTRFISDFQQSRDMMRAVARMKTDGN